ncbi:AMP-dependent synthetase/ligase [bacterium]|nr:AMP-dependent synthetase/ligase [bacterium]
MTAQTNLSAMHRVTANRLGPRSAMAYKSAGMYRLLTWNDYRRRADEIAVGLVSLGIVPGDRVAMISENRTEWLFSDIGMLAAGAVTVPLHAPLSPKQVEYQLHHSDSRGVFVSNQVQANKVLEVIDRVPNLEFIVSFDPIDTKGRIKTLTLSALRQIGFQAGAEGLKQVLDRESSTKPDDLATIIYTSGTTGLPKGVMLSHGNLLYNTECVYKVSSISGYDHFLSWLPFSHIYARVIDHFLSVMAGAIMYLAESIDTLPRNLVETQPTAMSAVPRFYEKIWAMLEVLPKEMRNQKLRQLFGMRIDRLSAGGAPLPKHIAEGFLEAGLTIYEGYGMTESGCALTSNRPGENKPGTVGKPIPGMDVAIAPDGEVITRGPHIMKGYWKNLEATQETIIDGWLHTGDVGEFDSDGYLKITDRKKDIFVTSGGKNISPAELERALTEDVYIEQAVVYGDGKNFITAMLIPNPQHLAPKLKELNATLDSDGEFATDPKLMAFLSERVAAAMAAFSKPERVKAFLIRKAPFTVESDELTVSLKVRRRFVMNKYKEQFEAFYKGAPPGDLHEDQ